MSEILKSKKNEPNAWLHNVFKKMQHDLVWITHIYKLLFTLTLHTVRKQSNQFPDGQNPVPPYIFVLFKKLFHIYITKNRKENYYYFRFMPILRILNYPYAKYAKSLI